MPPLRDEYVACLEAENEELRERLKLLEAQLGMTFEYPPLLGLSGSEGGMLGLLMQRDLLTKDAAMTCLFSHRVDDEVPEIKIVDVFVCKLRKKLEPFHIEIKTQWGRGYYMTPEAKKAVAALMPGRVGE